MNLSHRVAVFSDSNIHLFRDFVNGLFQEVALRDAFLVMPVTYKWKFSKIVIWEECRLSGGGKTAERNSEGPRKTVC